MNKKILQNAFFAACALALFGCLVPEKFTAKVNLKPDGSYSFSYSGTAVNALVAAQIAQGGALSEKDLKILDADAEKLKKNGEIHKAVHKGNGRYELEIKQEKLAGQPLTVMGTFSVRTDKAGVMTISSIELKDKDKREWTRLGLTINGTLEVHVPKDAEVLSHNATSTPTLGFGAYSWNIGRIDEQPMMKLKFKHLASNTTDGARSSKLESFLKEENNKPSKYKLY